MNIGTELALILRIAFQQPLSQQLTHIALYRALTDRRVQRSDTWRYLAHTRRRLPFLGPVRHIQEQSFLALPGLVRAFLECPMNEVMPLHTQLLILNDPDLLVQSVSQAAQRIFDELKHIAARL